jgi:Na+-translocating ferredoxin:NAD+ oxidoreductase RNF subunit RnfB
MQTIIVTAIFSVILAFVLGVLLGIFRRIFHVETDVLVNLVRETLPGANCGACGFPGCDGYAAAVAAKTAAPNKCTVSSSEETHKRGELLGVNVVSVPKAAFLACGGTHECAPLKGDYNGTLSCQGAKISAAGTKLCAWGCIGFGDCVSKCQFGALSMGEDGLPVVDTELCTGCGLCAAACPQSLLRLLDKNTHGPAVRCANANPIKPAVRKSCKAGCIKCEICVKNCPAQAIVMKNGVPDFDYTKCLIAGGKPCTGR